MILKHRYGKEYFFWGSFFIIILLHITSCNKEPETVGKGLLAEEELEVGLDTTGFMHAHSVPVDSVYTEGKGFYPLGSIYDGVFGMSESSLYFNLRTPNSTPFDSNGMVLQVDSVILSLNLLNFYGDVNTTQTFHVFQLAESFDTNKNYFSTDVIPLNLERGEVGSRTFYGKAFSGQLAEDKDVSLHIPLDPVKIGEYVLNTEDSILKSGIVFAKHFKGLAIIPEPVQEANKGFMSFVDFSEIAPKVTIYYNDTSYSFKMIPGTSNVFANYKHNYLVSGDEAFKRQILEGDTASGTDGIYLEGMTGIRSLIYFPGIQDWVNGRKLFIHQAKLLLPVESGGNPSFTPPNKLKLMMKTPSGIVSLPDEAHGTLSGGTYSNLNKRYEYTITMYIQELVNGTMDFPLHLTMNGESYIPNRVKIMGTSPELDRNIRLKIVYSELQ